MIVVDVNTIAYLWILKHCGVRAPRLHVFPCVAASLPPGSRPIALRAAPCFPWLIQLLGSIDFACAQILNNASRSHFPILHGTHNK
jgi:hypothetical protein